MVNSRNEFYGMNNSGNFSQSFCIVPMWAAKSWEERPATEQGHH